MVTHLLNSIPHSKGPNKRIPSNFYGNRSSNKNCSLNWILCGLWGATLCIAAYSTYHNYTPTPLTSSDSAPKYGIAVIVGSLLLFVVGCVLLIMLNVTKRQHAAMSQPKGPECEPKNLLCQDASHLEKTKNLSS